MSQTVAFSLFNVPNAPLVRAQCFAEHCLLLETVLAPERDQIPLKFTLQFALVMFVVVF